MADDPRLYPLLPTALVTGGLLVRPVDPNSYHANSQYYLSLDQIATYAGAQAGAITSIVAGTGLTGGGSSGVVTLSLTTTYAPLTSPGLLGLPTAPTPTLSDSSTLLATTAFVKGQGYILANQTITLSGDITGSGTTAITATLATVNANVGTFQGLTVNGKGLVTAAANQNYAQTTGATFTGKLNTLASATGTAGFNMPHGAAPTSPVNGDAWTTTAGLFARINGATVGPFAASGTGISGMTAGQIPIAATATTITSSANLSGDVTSNSTLVTTLATVNANVGTFQGLTVNAKGLVTAAVNQGYLTGNQTVTLSGDASGSGATAITVTFATVNSNVGTFQGITVNGKGLVTAASDQGYAQKAGATFTGELITVASATGTAGFNLPHGAAPTAPVNGDTWTTTAGMFVRINGGTIGPLGGTGTTGLSGMTAGQIPIAATATTVTSSANLSGDITSNSTLVTTLATVNANVGTFQGLTVNAKGLVTAASDQGYAQKIGATFTGEIVTVASATGTAGFNLPHGVAPTSPVNGDIWTTTSGLLARINGATVGPYIAGNQTVTLSGDVTGSGATAITATLATVNSNVGTFQGITVNGKGLVTAAADQAYLQSATAATTYLALAGGTVTGQLNLANALANTLKVQDTTALTTGVGGLVALQGLNGSAAQVTYAAVKGYATNGTAGAESGDLKLEARRGGTLTVGATLESTGRFVTSATTATVAGFNLPHGTAPTSPANGDTWTTTAGLFAQINGSTVGPYGTSGTLPSGTTRDQLVFSGGVWTAQRPKWSIASYVPGVPTATQTVLMHRCATAVTIPINFGTYLGLASQAGGSVNATASTVFTLAKAANATPTTFSTVGTITFAAGSVTPTFATTGGTTISCAQGDVLRLQGPGTPDATFADFNCVIVGFET